MIETKGLKREKMTLRPGLGRAAKFFHIRPWTLVPVREFGGL